MRGMKHPFDSAANLLKAWKPTSTSHSPKATGIPGKFTFQKPTVSGKPIHSAFDHPAHFDFDARDHSDAYFAHKNHVSELESLKTNQDGTDELIAYHKKQMRLHREKMFELGTKV